MLRPLLLNTTINEERAKFREEVMEFTLALLGDNKEHIIEEFYDAMQVAINLMDKKGIDITEIIRGEFDHYKKMQDRKYKIKIEVEVGDFVIYDGDIMEVVKKEETYLELREEEGGMQFIATPYEIERLPF